MWWSEENWKTVLPSDVSWREYADECLTYDHMVHRAFNSAVECHPDAMEATGSNPVSPT